MQAPSCGTQLDDILYEMKAVEIIQHHHIKGGGGPFFLVATYVQVGMIGATVEQAVDEPGIPTEGKDNRLVRCEQHVEGCVAQAVGVFARRLELHEVHHIDHTDFQIRRVRPEGDCLVILIGTGRIAMTKADGRRIQRVAFTRRTELDLSPDKHAILSNR